jgi:hypothetical protein
MWCGCWWSAASSTTSWATCCDPNYRPGPSLRDGGLSYPIAPNSPGFRWMGGVKVDDTYLLDYALSAGAEGIGVITGTVGE